ncbi:MAG: DUF4935 domain-containing protein [Tatlockia sp.]|nr:DUF4935 domain-containing protein [Tatlockia sp.]
MNIFIDTNVFLSFFHLSKDDLEEIHKLVVLLEKNEITLWTPRQVIDEFYRNRENKIHDAIKKLKEQKLNAQFPQFCKDYEEFLIMKDHEKRYNQHLQELINKIQPDITNNTLKADRKLKNYLVNPKLLNPLRP